MIEEGESVGFSMDKSKFIEHLDNNENVLERFTELMFFASYKREPTETPQYFIDNKYQRIHYEFLNSMELFIAGHEYGHIIAGHLNNNVLKRKVKNSDIDIIQTNWKEEYEADAIGLNLMINSLDKSNFSPFCYLGADLFFSFLDIDERVYTFINHGYEQVDIGSDSHPPVNERKKYIRQYFNDGLKGDDKLAYMGFSSYIDDIIETLWERLKNEIVSFSTK